LLKVQLPEPVSEAISLTGSMTTPLSMLIIGSLLADVPLRGMLRGKEIYLGSFIRLIAMPLLVYGLMRLLPIPKEVLHICVILTAMPASVNTAILSKKYGGDALLASRFISITTIFSMFTIPLIMMLL
jgi:predicted permease